MEVLYGKTGKFLKIIGEESEYHVAKYSLHFPSVIMHSREISM